MFIEGLESRTFLSATLIKASSPVADRQDHESAEASNPGGRSMSFAGPERRAAGATPPRPLATSEDAYPLLESSVSDAQTALAAGPGQICTGNYPGDFLPFSGR
jgi:hypothetical protein